MKFFAKNGIGFYLLICLLFKIRFLIPKAFVEVLYYSIMFIGIVLFLNYSKLILSKKMVHCFAIFYTFFLLSSLYFLFFNDLKSGLYLLAKFASGTLIILGVLLNYEKYKHWFAKYFKYLMLLIIVLGKLYGTVAESEELDRLSLGFNPNSLGEFGLFGLLAILILEDKWFRNTINIVLVAFFAVIILISGSKGALICLVIAVFLLYKISFRMVIVSALFLVLIQFSSSLGFITSIDRLSSQESLFDSRDLVFEIGMQTFQDNIWFGHGLDKYAWTDPKYWDYPELMLPPHSTYLGILIMYGIIIGIPLILVLLWFPMKTFKTAYKSSDRFVVFCYILVVIILIKGYSESLIIGLNEFASLLFWFAIGVVAYNHSFGPQKTIHS
jgi:O-antigen ligase